MTQHSEPYLPAGLPIPGPERDGLSKPYWEGLKAGRLVMFPSWLLHQVRPYRGNSERISVAFNLTV